MSKTPEGKVKDAVRAFLKSRGVASLSHPVRDAVGYYHMYVPSGYGDPALDFTGCYKGRFFSIETKAAGNVPSARQNLILDAIERAGGFTLWGDDAVYLCERLKRFFDSVDGHK